MKATTVYKISDRGIMTLAIIASLMSLPLVGYLHKIQYSSRALYNPMYKGSYGGEALIPVLIIVVSALYTAHRKDRRKYEKH